MDEVLFTKWFELFKNVMDEHEILAENTYNMDEKGYVMGLIANLKVSVSARAKHKFMQQLGTWESVTVIECVSGNNVVIPLLIIWSAKTHQNTWYSICLDLQIRFAISLNVYTNNELGLE